MISFPNLQLNSSRSFGLDLTGWLDDGVTISSVNVFSKPRSISITDIVILPSLKVAKATFSPKKAGDYKVVFEFSLSDGQIEARAVDLKVKEYKSA